MICRVVRQRRAQRGAAAIEFAIVLPVLLLIVLGTIDWGWYFFVREAAIHAAREGARAGAVSTSTGSGPMTEAEDRAEEYLAALGLSGGEASASPGTDSVIVRVRYPASASSGFSITGFLTAVMPEQIDVQAEMRR